MILQRLRTVFGVCFGCVWVGTVLWPRPLLAGPHLRETAMPSSFTVASKRHTRQCTVSLDLKCIFVNNHFSKGRI